MIVRNTPDKGRIIISDKSFNRGDVIAISDGIPLRDSEMPDKKAGSPIWSYVFNGFKSGYILVLDWTSIMDHSETPNVDYHPVSETQVQFTALEDIKIGDELTINYGYDLKEHDEQFGLNQEEWNKRTTTLHDFVGNLAPSMMGSSISDHSIKSAAVSSLGLLKSYLQGAPRTTKEAFNALTNYIKTYAESKR